MKYATIIFSLMFLFTTIYGQQKNGTIKGTVKDSKSGELLIGCTVIIQGTTTGTSTDIDGNFTLSNVKPGSYNLVVSYISYDQNITRVAVKEGETVTANVDLNPSSIEIGEAVVTAQRKKESDIAVLSTIKSSDVIVSGIGAQQISKSQDKDAADVIRKVPGITISDGRFVIVRGLVERYNTIWLNGATAPSFEADSRAFSFDAIPSNMIGNILIFKTPAPELPADFAGATIKIITKNDADDNSLKVSYGAGYDPGLSFKKFYKDKPGKKEWLGYDDGTKSLPKNFPNSLEMEDIAYWSYNEDYAEFKREDKKNKEITMNLYENRGFKPEEKKAYPNQSFSIGLTRRFTLGKISMGNITALNYGTSWDYTQYDRELFNFYGNTYDYKYKDDNYSQTNKGGLIHNWLFVFGKNQKIEIRNFFNQLGKTQTIFREGTNYYKNWSLYQENMKYQSRSIYCGQIAGDHNLFNNRTKIDWLGGYSYTNKNEPDDRRFLWIYDSVGNKDRHYELQFDYLATPTIAGRLFQRLDENVYNGALNLEQKADIWGNGNLWSFKTGYFYEGKERSFWLRNLGFVKASGNPKDKFEIDLFSDINSIIKPENFYNKEIYKITPERIEIVQINKWEWDTIVYPADTIFKSGIYVRENTRPQDSYKATNKLHAGYFGVKIPFGTLITFYGGVRMESFNRRIYDFYRGKDTITQAGKDTLDIKYNSLDLFPSANISLNITKKMLVRLSYGQTVNRPEFRELAIFEYNNFEDNASMIGNPLLKPCYIHNVDVRYEIYPSASEMVTLGAFYKYFDNPIELYFDPGKGSGIGLVPLNTKQGISQGLEFDARKSMSTIKSIENIYIIKNLTVVMNISYIVSKIKTQEINAR
ncbi:MAG: TonB-dependent receptor, partial [Bacteroidales bacterium]